MNRAVFLDRDNTIIHNDGDLGEPDKVRLIQGAATAIASLCGLGYKIVVVTNQGGVARGLYGEDDVMLVHERIAQLVREAANGARIDRFYYCPFHPDGVVDEYRCEHPSRKPAPGMIFEAAQDLNIDLAQSWTIGDQARDVEAGHAAGTRTILLSADAEQPKEVGESAASPPAKRSEQSRPPDYTARNLTEAVRIIAHARRPEAAEHLHHAHVGGKRFDAATVAKLQQQGRAPSQETDSATEPDAPAPGGERRTAGKPFRPWSQMPGDDEGEGEDRGTRVRTMFRKLRAEKEAAQGEAAPAVERPAEAVQPPLSSVGVEGAAEPHKPAPVDEATEATPQATVSVPPRATESRQPTTASDHTLRLILQELRNQRGTQGEFSYLFVVAIVLQMIAGVCLLGGLWMGIGEAPDSTILFFRWLMVALVMQIATVAALLFGRQ